MSRMFNRNTTIQTNTMDSFLEAIINKKKAEIQAKFNVYDEQRLGYIKIQEFKEKLKKLGLNPETTAIKQQLAAYEKIGSIDLLEFTKLLTAKKTVLQKALQNELAIANFGDFCKDLIRLCDEAKKVPVAHATPAQIPELGKVDENTFAIAFCTIDGQQFAHGDAFIDFTMQHVALPIIYCLACEQNGVGKVHEIIGREPSGAPFNAFTLNADKKPHNPMNNMGGIITSSVLQPQDNPSSRFGNVYDIASKMAGGKKVSFHQHIYLSEKSNADRNRALAFYMRAHGVKGLDNSKLGEILDFYLQVCSLACSTNDLSVIAATLANGGICPLSSQRVISAETVRSCLGLLYSCGMYDYSGQFAFSVGLPAKSGVSGAIMVVIPNVMGFAVYSPPVDHRGNSIRGIHFLKQLSKTFNFSIFDQLVGGVSTKVDPTVANNNAMDME